MGKELDDYDLLLVGYNLPGVTGLEIINRARELDHRCGTPMVVLAGSPVEAAARKAGADVFCRSHKTYRASLRLSIAYLRNACKRREYFETWQ